MNQQDRIIYYRLLAAELKSDRLTKTEAARLANVYNEAIKKLVDEIGLTDIPTTRQLLLLDVLIKQAQALVDPLTDGIVDHTTKTAKNALQATYDALSINGAIEGLTFVKMTEEQIRSLIADKKYNGKTIRQWVEDSTVRPWAEFQSEVLSGMILGKGVDPITKELAYGVGKKARRDIKTLVISYANHSGTDARHKVYDANKDFIEEYEWNAALEVGAKSGRGTCPRCAALDGQKWKKKGDAPSIPLHMRCRCVLIPVTKPVPGISKDEWNKLEAEARKEMEEQFGFSRPTKPGGIPSFSRTNNDFSEWVLSDNERLKNVVGPKKAEWIKGFSEGKQKDAFGALVVSNKEYRDYLNGLKVPYGDNKQYKKGDNVTIPYLEAMDVDKAFNINK